MRHGQAQQILLHRLFHPAHGKADLREKVRNKLRLHGRICHRLRDEIQQIQDLNPALAKGCGKLVVLLAGMHQIRDVLEELAGEVLGHQVFELLPRTVQQHALELPDLTFDPNG